MQEIGNIYGTTADLIRQHVERAIRVLHHPTRKIFLYLGVQGAQKAIALKSDWAPNAPEGVSSPSINALNLNIRGWNCLRRAGVDTIEELIQHTENELMQHRTMGAKTLKEIKDRLMERGLSLKSEEDAK